MCLAMFCMAFAAVSLVSCGSDDDEEVAFYQVKATASIHDPNNELTAEQTKFLLNYLNSVGSLDTGINRNQKEVENQTETWAYNVGKNIVAFLDNNPEVLKTEQAGVKFQFSGTSRQSGIILFKNAYKELKK